MELEQHLENVLACVQSNSNTLERFQKFERDLLNLQSLSEMVEYVLDSQDYFDLDYIGFCLIDTKNDIQKYLTNSKFDFKHHPRLIFLEDKKILHSAFGRFINPYLGAYKSSKCADFFVSEKYKPASVAVIPLIRRGQFLGVLSLGSFDSERYVDTMATNFIEHMTSVIAVCLENNLNYEAVKYESFIDPLTGVNNRRFFEQRLSEEISTVHRNLVPISCLFLDIDFFKKVNDTYGHQAGDTVLIKVADMIATQLRHHDTLARFGGEEFITLLNDTDEETALIISQRIIDKIRELDVDVGDQNIKVTISIGCITYQPIRNTVINVEDISETLIKQADDALYIAKDSGRDQVISSGIISK